MYNIYTMLDQMSPTSHGTNQTPHPLNLLTRHTVHCEDIDEGKKRLRKITRQYEQLSKKWSRQQ